MKNGFFLAAVAAVLANSSTTILATDHPIRLDAAELFVPKGFDDNDNVEIMLDGWYESACFKLVDPTIEVDGNTISVQAQVVRSGALCNTKKMLRFTQVVELGALPFGSYEVVTNAGAIIESLDIAEATNAGPDDYHYAHVEKVQAQSVPGENNNLVWSAVIDGYFSNSCQRMKEVRVIDSGKTFELLPILQEGARTQKCFPLIVPFSWQVALPDFDAGRYLLHARSFGGKSVNKAFSVYE